MENSLDINMLDPPGVRGYHGTAAANAHYPDTAGMSLRAAQACSACRKQKRKCNKTLPTCSLCSRMGRPCDYSDSAPTPNADGFSQLRKKVVDLEARLDANNNGFSRHSSIGSRGSGLSPRNSSNPDQTSTFPSLFFLDSEMYHETRMTIPRPTIAVSSDVAAILGSVVDVRDIVERFFANVHLWLPIISKKRMQLTLENHRLELTADLALLLLSMKLVMQTPHGGPQDAQNQLYATVKRHTVIIETGGLISLQLMQALILTATYEIGHAVYPAAYLTTGQCTRLGHLMGIHDRRATPQVLKRSGAWAEVEEVKRAWWACTLLDRYVSLGLEGRPNATEDSLPSTVLPADDTSWDQGEMATSEPLYLSTPTAVRAGAFARTCQATHLLGRLERLLNDRKQESSVRFTEAAQLHRTLEALANLLPGEIHKSPTRYCTPWALSYGAIIHLCDPFGCPHSDQGDHTAEEIEMQEIAIAGMKKTAADILQLTQVLKSIMNNNLSAVSPLTADALYMAAATYAWLAYESGSPDSTASYHAIRAVLIQMNQRWAVAGEYLKALDVTKTALYQDNPNL